MVNDGSMYIRKHAFVHGMTHIGSPEHLRVKHANHIAILPHVGDFELTCGWLLVVNRENDSHLGFSTATLTCSRNERCVCAHMVQMQTWGIP